MEVRRTTLTLCVLLLAKVFADQDCESGLHTSQGECCDFCPPGSGVTTPCAASNTKCEPCRAGVTFSSVNSTTGRCQPCRTCPERMQMVSACTPSVDTTCDCTRGHYRHVLNGTIQCLPCRVCRQGYGASVACSSLRNTECEACPKGFYSEEASSFSPCSPCQKECNESEVMIHDCSPLSNTVCMVKELLILKRDESEDHKTHQRRPSEVESSTSPGSPEFIPQEDSKNIIPVYCSILAAIVVGLLAYVAFKCWSTCKQKKQLAKARAAELSTSPEGEKLHSDSGVFLDTHSLQEQHQLNKVIKAEPNFYIGLPPHKQDEVEQLLRDSGRGKDWQRLASLLGYKEESIDVFGHGEDPVHTLLSDWSAKDGGALDVLCASLVNMGRADVVENLKSTAEASSVV
ncbi:tumor necrosis factor receptor superfamily member 16 [Microcaecilia unicolor]|uniref:Tumor necrosis factor receptor superfamily member 16-like n=1 Tax=Microcaecilia unicolor TaxID=1415580 RepID=A0A6P7X5A4_9AMPH|nr:tumor necrosis factor receptor superfamily member 16-like [Microcaecilia unicolor]